MIRKIESDERRPSLKGAALLAEALVIPQDQQDTFLKVARQERAVDQLGSVDEEEPFPWQTAPQSQTNLPLPATLFRGREADLASLADMFQDPTCCLVTLVGPAGIGKTRLAVQAAHGKLDRFEHGLFFVSLAPLYSAETIVATIANAIGFQFHGAVKPEGQLLRYLREKRMLLVLDNFEHLMEGVSLLPRIMQAAPGVQLLVTSRERLNLQGEWVFEVEGLPYPVSPKESNLEEEAAYGAVQLFLQGALRVNPRFSLKEENREWVVRICQLTEGNPLGLELTAAWVRVLSCQVIAEEIESNLDFLKGSAQDIPERHRSLRAALDHSWKLLSADEKAVFRRLSVFRGGFRREAAREVAGAGLEALTSLIDKSLLRRVGEERYDLHELIRQYAAIKLPQNRSEYMETRDRHCSYFTALLQQHEVPLKGARQKESVTNLALETDNIRIAWIWAIDQGKITEIRQAVYSLWRFYYVQNWYEEGEAIFRYASERMQIYVSGKVSASNKAEATITLGQVLAKQGWFCFHQGQHARAKELLSQSLALVRPLDDSKALADGLLFLGVVTMLMGDYQQAYQFIEESLAISMAVGDQWITALCLSNLGMIAHMSGDYPEAYRLFQDSLEEWRVVGDPYLTAFCLNFFGALANDLGQYAEAEDLIREGLATAQTNEDRWGIATALNQLGLILCMRGKARREEARDLFGESIARFKELGDHWSLARALNNMGMVTAALGDYSAAQRCFRDAMRIAMEARTVPIVLDALVGTADVLVAQNSVAAERTLGVLLQVLAHSAAGQETRARAERLRTELVAKLTPQQIEAAQAWAQARNLESVAQEILTGIEIAPKPAPLTGPSGSRKIASQ